MTFIWPTMLLSLLLIPLFVFLYLRRQQQRRQLVTHYGSFGLLQAAGKQVGARRHVPPLLFLASLTLLMLAMARPEAVVRLRSKECTPTAVGENPVVACISSAGAAGIPATPQWLGSSRRNSGKALSGLRAPGA